MALRHDNAGDELIPADSVDDLLRRVRVGVEQLDVELKEVQLEIVQLEVELASHARDILPGDDRLEAARTAIEVAAVGAQDHLGTVVAAARAHAAARVAAAEAEAGWIVQTAREEVARSLVAPLALGDPLAAADLPPRSPAVTPAAQLAGWCPDPETRSVPSAPGSAAAPPGARPPAVDPSASEEVARPDLSSTSGFEPPESSAERAFWADELELSAPRRDGADLFLTGMSALLVLAILAIVLAWIG